MIVLFQIICRSVTKRTPLTVGVFQNQTPEEINAIIDETGIDLVQLHGQETPDVIDTIKAPCIKVLHIPSSGNSKDSDAAVLMEAHAFSHKAIALLLDTKISGDSSGGTGVTFDWDIVDRIDLPVILAGGLHEGNILDAMSVNGVIGVDASSGLEIDPIELPGEKDIRKLRNYITKIRPLK